VITPCRTAEFSIVAGPENTGRTACKPGPGEILPARASNCDHGIPLVIAFVGNATKCLQN